MTSPVHPRLAAIAAIVSDVDGVLTDGTVGVLPGGQKFRTFHVHDGMGVQLLKAAGLRIGWMSSSVDDGVIRARAQALGVHAVDVGDGDKGERFRRLCAALGIAPERALYLGDDVNDLPAFAIAGVAACPSDARPEVVDRAAILLRATGGRGAFREAADMILRAKGFDAAEHHAGALNPDPLPLGTPRP